jgi:hypothetical protein
MAPAGTGQAGRQAPHGKEEGFFKKGSRTRHDFLAPAPSRTVLPKTISELSPYN